MIQCDNNCENCGLYTSYHKNGGEYEEYDCPYTGKTVTIYYENGEEVKRVVS